MKNNVVIGKHSYVAVRINSWITTFGNTFPRANQSANDRCRLLAHSAIPQSGTAYMDSSTILIHDERDTHAAKNPTHIIKPFFIL